MSQSFYVIFILLFVLWLLTGGAEYISKEKTEGKKLKIIIQVVFVLAVSAYLITISSPSE